MKPTAALLTPIVGNAALRKSYVEGQARPVARSPRANCAETTRVLHVHSGNLYGGVETLMLTLAKHQYLCSDLEHHFALCFANRFSQELSALGVPLHSLGSVRVSRPLSVWRVRRQLKKLLRENSFDVVVCHSAWTQGIFGPVVRSANLPLVFWLHDIPDGLPWPERWARRTRPDLILCNSRYTAERLPGLYPANQSRVIYCPVAPPSINLSRDEIDAVRAEFKTPKEAVVILQISRLEPHKGHLAHLEALSLMRDAPGWVCWQVCGAQKPEEVRYFEQVKETARRLGIDDRVRFLGWQPDAQRLLAASDIYCQPNIYPEPFGITFIEALYAKKPVVATSLGGPKEIVDESCGFLVAPNDARVLADTLSKLIEDERLRNQLGNAGPPRAKKLCDPATQIRCLHEAFLSVSKNGHD